MPAQAEATPNHKINHLHEGGAELGYTGPPQELEPEQMPAPRAGNPLAYLAIQETITLKGTMLCVYTGTSRA